MKKLLYIFLGLTLMFGCNEEDSKLDPMLGTWEGTVEFNGQQFKTRSIAINSGTMSWDIFLKNEDGLYIERYYWPELKYDYVKDDNWLMGKIEETETRKLVFMPAAINTGRFISETDSIDTPISFNNHYGVADYNLDMTEVSLRNVCVPQEGKLANDELCDGWENWESTTVYYSIKVK